MKIKNFMKYFKRGTSWNISKFPLFLKKYFKVKYFIVHPCLHLRLSHAKPTSDDLVYLLRSQPIHFSMWPQLVCMARDPTVVWSLLSTEPLRIPAYHLYRQKLEYLSYMTAAAIYSIGLSIFDCTERNNIVFECQEKTFKTSVNAPPHCPLTYSF